MHGKIILRADIICLENTGYWRYIKQQKDYAVHDDDRAEMQNALEMFGQHNEGVMDAPDGDTSWFVAERLLPDISNEMNAHATAGSTQTQATAPN